MRLLNLGLCVLGVGPGEGEPVALGVWATDGSVGTRGTQGMLARLPTCL